MKDLKKINSQITLTYMLARPGEEDVPQRGSRPEDLALVQGLGGKAMLGPSQRVESIVTPSGGLGNTRPVQNWSR